MAPAIVHFLVGASIVLLVASLLAIRLSFSPWTPLWLVVLGGLWGLWPDLHQITPVYEAELRAFHDSRFANRFAFHYTLDQPAVRSQQNASILWSILLFLGATTTFTVATVLGCRDDGERVTDAPTHSLLATLVVVGTLVVVVGLGIGFTGFHTAVVG